MANKQPLVSIIIPYYNSGLFLERTLASIKNQTHTNWELLFVDDGSSDNGPELVTKMMADDKRVFSLKRPEQGFKSGGRGAKNYGYLKIKGDYVVFFDSDDYMLPNYLEERSLVLQEEANVDVVFTDFGWKVASDLLPKKTYIYDSKFNTDFSLLKKTVDFWKSYADLNFFWVPSNMMWRSSSIKQIKWNEETTIGEDFEYNTQAILAGLQFKHLNKTTWYYMRNENSMMATSENPLQIEKRSFFMSIVLEKLVTARYVDDTDDLVAHFMKDQYRFIRRIISASGSSEDKYSKIKTIISRIKMMLHYFEHTSFKKHWKKVLLKSYFVISASLVFKKGSKMFDLFLIGKRTQNEVLKSQIVLNKDRL